MPTLPTETKSDLLKHLRFAALENAVRVRYELEIESRNESARLTSFDSDEKKLGDDRPYEILKARFEPLRRQAGNIIELFHGTEAVAVKKFSVELVLASEDLRIWTDEELVFPISSES